MSVKNITPQEIQDEFALDNKVSFVHYFFIIKTKNQSILRFHNGHSEYHIDGTIYMHHSSLELKECYFEDSGFNHATIHGLREDKETFIIEDLIDAEIEVSILLGKQLKKLFKYVCTEVKILDHEFYLKLEPETRKFSASAVSTFSKTCRANFGDKKCKVNIESLAKRYEIEKIDGNSILLKNLYEASGFYTLGNLQVYFTDYSGKNFIIKSHIGKIIALKENISFKANQIAYIEIYPGCDKKLQTCCKKFDNVINFRGEPFIPEVSILDN